MFDKKLALLWILFLVVAWALILVLGYFVADLVNALVYAINSRP